MLPATFKLIAALVVALLLAAIAVVWLPREAERSRIQTDRDHLHRLWENYLAGCASGVVTPGARGYRFWPTLITGEGPYHDGAVLSAAAGGRLVCSPNDPLADPTVVEYLLGEVRSGRRLDLDVRPDMVSYAGPRQSVFVTQLATRRAGRLIVGATGTRNGVGIYPGGYVFVRANLETGFMPVGSGDAALPDTVADIGDEPGTEDVCRVEWPYTSGRWFGDAGGEGEGEGEQVPQTAPGGETHRIGD
ncbi:MAG: hypothetical protein AB7K09_14295 [Planctomycetota bacterium]